MKRSAWDCTACDAADEIAALLAKLAEARELVAKLEWGQDDECPLCLRWRFAKSPLGHNPDCPVRKFLGAP